MKYVIFTLQEMTPEQLKKQNPITVHPNQKLDIEEGVVLLITFDVLDVF